MLPLMLPLKLLLLRLSISLRAEFLQEGNNIN